MTTKLDMPLANGNIKDYDTQQSVKVNGNIDEIGTIKQSILTILSKLNLISDWVIESGSNANGNWEKWNSGKLVQWGRRNLTSVGGGGAVMTLPIPFINNNFETFTRSRWMSQYDYYVVTYEEALSVVKARPVPRTGTYSGEFSFGWYSIGLWKV